MRLGFLRGNLSQNATKMLMAGRNKRKARLYDLSSLDIVHLITINYPIVKYILNKIKGHYMGIKASILYARRA